MRFEIGPYDFRSDESKSAFFRIAVDLVYVDCILDGTTPRSSDQQNNRHKTVLAPEMEPGQAN